jgi:hypothetical protein
MAIKTVWTSHKAEVVEKVNAFFSSIFLVLGKTRKPE